MQILISATFSLDYAPVIGNIEVPVFVIAGKCHFIISSKQVKELSDKFLHSQYYVNEGHICFIDDASEYFRGLIEFIKSY